jgi:glycosyltransferase involved in cell wall biosynthesis
MKVSFIIPVINNFKYTKGIYKNLKEYFPEDEIIISDGGSIDETIEYFKDKSDIIFVNNGKCNLGENYNKAIENATSDIIILLHNDMFIPPNFKDKILKDLSKKSVVSYTRVEPPIFPGENPGKVVCAFGNDIDDLNKEEFIKFTESYNKKDIGGSLLFFGCFKSDWIQMDTITFNPPQMWCSDDDIHLRFNLMGMNKKVSDACVYHFVSKTSRKGNYQQIEQHSNKNFIRKWSFRNSKHNKKYNTAFIVHNCSLLLLEALEPWCDRIYVNEKFNTAGRAQDYIERESENTSFDLSKRVLNIKENDPYSENDIILEFDALKFSPEAFNIIQNLSDIITESGEVGEFELDCFKVTIHQLVDYSNELIYIRANT